MGRFSDIFGGTLSRLKDYGHSVGTKLKKFGSNTYNGAKSAFNKGVNLYNEANKASGGRLGQYLGKGVSMAVNATQFIPGVGPAIHGGLRVAGKVMRKATNKDSAWHSLGRALSGKDVHSSSVMRRVNKSMSSKSAEKSNTSSVPSKGFISFASSSGGSSNLTTSKR